MWQHYWRHYVVFAKTYEEFTPHYLAPIRHDLSQTTKTDDQAVHSVPAGEAVGHVLFLWCAKSTVEALAHAHLPGVP